MKSIPWEEVPEDKLIQGIRRRIVTGDQVDAGAPLLP